MKKIILLFVFAVSISCAQKSPREQANGTIDGINISVDYGSPSVKDRTIWGGLEQYGSVWRAGANGNTTISFDKDVLIGSKKLKAGKYGFFIIPNENADWVIIFNSKNDAWGAFSYNESEDVLRLKLLPSFVDDTQEALKYSVNESFIDFAWGKARLSILIKSVQ